MEHCQMIESWVVQQRVSAIVSTAIPMRTMSTSKEHGNEQLGTGMAAHIKCARVHALRPATRFRETRMGL